MYGLRASNSSDRTARIAFAVSIIAACFLPPAAALDSPQFTASSYHQQFQPKMRFYRQQQPAPHSAGSAPLNTLHLRGGNAGGAVAEQDAQLALDKLDTMASEVSRVASSLHAVLRIHPDRSAR